MAEAALSAEEGPGGGPGLGFAGTAQPGESRPGRFPTPGPWRSRREELTAHLYPWRWDFSPQARSGRSSLAPELLLEGSSPAGQSSCQDLRASYLPKYCPKTLALVSNFSGPV